MGCYEPFFPEHPCADPQPPYFLTAYEIAVKRGFRGTEEEWLESLTCFGQAQVAGYTGTIEDWIATLIDPVPDLQIGEVVTLEGGSMATATITGDKKKPILNLGIPRGLGMADALPIIGGEMKGDINMDGHCIRSLSDPTEDGDAAPKSYVDERLKKDGTEAMTGNLNMGSKRITNLATPTANTDAAPKSYVDEKRKPFSATLSASGWSAAAPYTQTIEVAGILETDCPHWTVVYSDNAATAIAEKEAFAVVDDLDTADGSVTFTCLEEKPEVDLTIQMEVNR